MKAGPRAPLPPLRSTYGAFPARVVPGAVRFIERYVTVPKGTGARHRLRIRPWQREIITGVLDEPRPRQALLSIPTGNGKSTLAAALGLYGLLGDRVEGAQVLVVASDERQARIIYTTVARMVELDTDLADRVQVFKDHLLEPRTNSVFMASQPTRAPSKAGTRRWPSWTRCTWSPTTPTRPWPPAPASGTARCCWPSPPRPGPARMTA